MQIILASASPRRRQLAASMGLELTTTQVDTAETIPPGLPASRAAEHIALLKAAAYNTARLAPDQLLLTADTVVDLNGSPLGKPHSRTEAVAMLQSLSGRSHWVHTGVCLALSSRQTSFTESTRVHFNPLSTSTIEHYVDTFSPYDKAGAYGIQEWIGLVGINHIEGCYYNVMGLPTARLYQELATFCPEALKH